MHASILFILMLASSTASANARICAGIDALGQLQVTTHAASSSSMCFDPSGSADMPLRAQKMPRNGVAPRSTAYDSLIIAAARETGVEARLLHAVIHVESRYDHRARSPAGAVGLMQIMPRTGKRFGVTDLLNPQQNIRAGAAYLKWLMARFKGDMTLAIAAYNAGEGAVQRHGNKVPGYPETQNYVARVLARYGTS